MGYVDTDLGQPRSVLLELRARGFDVIVVDLPSSEVLHPTVPIKIVHVPAFVATPSGISVVFVDTQRPNLIPADGGADYVERNALALVALIKRVNTTVAANNSTSKNVIFGPSMGGLISRYVLAYMEKKFAQTGDVSWQHNTRLWVSIDSPHLGANVPMGDQALLHHLEDDNSTANEFYNEKLRSPAAQEMLIEQHRELNANYNVTDPNFLNAQINSQNLPLNTGNSYFQTQFANQSANGLSDSNGFPVNLRKIALVNGSLTGSKNTVNNLGIQKQPFANDGEAIINLRGFQTINIPVAIFFNIKIRTLIAVLESYNMPAVGNFARISRFKKGFSDHTTQSSNNNSRGCMDNVPGGFFKAQDQIAEPALGQSPINPGNFNSSALVFYNISNYLGGSYWDVHAFNPNHSFIPTFSALAHLQPNQSWSTPLNVNLVCSSNKQTPFDSYYGEANNSEHTSFNKTSVDWLMKEMGNPSTNIPPIPQAPYFPIQAGTLEGYGGLCGGEPQTYTFSDLCKIPSALIYQNDAGATVNGWSVEGPLQILSYTDYSVTVKAISNYGSVGKVIATFQNGQKFEKNITIGTPFFPLNGVVNGLTSTTFNQNLTYSYSGGNPINGNTTYQWYVDAPSNDGGGPTCAWQITSGQGTPSITVTSGCIAAVAVVGLKSFNSCGASDIYTYVNISQSGNGGNNGNPDLCIPNLFLSPNPATAGSSVSVDFISPPDDICTNLLDLRGGQNTLKIYDFFGNLVYNKVYTTNLIQLNDLNLRIGFYTINVFTAKGYNKREIIAIK
jgi:hypothetical protein